MLLQICEHLGQTLRILYVSGEESSRQIKLRASRLGVQSPHLEILTETDVQYIMEEIRSTQPDLVMIDSIQTMNYTELNSSPGSVTQVRECTNAMMRCAKSLDIPIIVVGHVNKDGAIAGPKVLEHIVDAVLYFEGDRQMTYRILRAVKNRYGSTNEIGVFEMEDGGLCEVPNPSETLLAGRPMDAPGTCVTCVMEGVRPVLAEIQALVVPSSLGNPRRVSNGFEYNRTMLLLAVLEKRGGLLLGNCDSYLNVIGGLTLDEPAADLAVVLAMASSFRDRPVPHDLAAIGEVGLTGELRAVSALGQRLSEVQRLGFTKCLIPKRVQGKLIAPEGLELIRVSSIREALATLL